MVLSQKQIGARVSRVSRVYKLLDLAIVSYGIDEIRRTNIRVFIDLRGLELNNIRNGMHFAVASFYLDVKKIIMEVLIA